MRRRQSARLDHHLRSSTRPVLVNFAADRCPTVRAIHSVLDAIGAERAMSIDIVRIDVDAQPSIAEQHAIRWLPTVALFINGTERSRLVGTHPERYLDEWLDHWLLPASPSSGPRRRSLRRASSRHDRRLHS